MRKDLERSRAAQSNMRRSSVHFHYESEEEASSQIQNARAFNYSQSHITSESDDTIKTTNLYSNRLHQSSLSGFAVPAFNLPKDSKKKSDRTQKAEQQQFYTFLQTFGRGQSQFSSSQISNEFEQNETVCHRSSTAQKRDSSTNIINKQDKNQVKVVDQKEQRFNQKQEKFGIHEQRQEEEDSNQYEEQVYSSSKSSRRYQIFQKKKEQPKMVQFCVQTDFSPKKQTVFHHYEKRPYRKYEKKQRFERQDNGGCYENLVFVEFDQRAEQSQKKYPQRITRDCKPLQFWMGERIDYRRGGYWKQKNN